MIELLEEKDPGVWTMNHCKNGEWWLTSANLSPPRHYVSDNGKDFPELVDALWQAVKEVL